LEREMGAYVGVDRFFGGVIGVCGAGVGLSLSSKGTVGKNVVVGCNVFEGETVGFPSFSLFQEGAIVVGFRVVEGEGVLGLEGLLFEGMRVAVVGNKVLVGPVVSVGPHEVVGCQDTVGYQVWVGLRELAVIVGVALVGDKVLVGPVVSVVPNEVVGCMDTVGYQVWVGLGELAVIVGVALALGEMLGTLSSRMRV
jgi:hypothetical protein